MGVVLNSKALILQLCESATMYFTKGLSLASQFLDLSPPHSLSFCWTWMTMGGWGGGNMQSTACLDSPLAASFLVFFLSSLAFFASSMSCAFYSACLFFFSTALTWLETIFLSASLNYFFLSWSFIALPLVLISCNSSSMRSSLFFWARVWVWKPDSGAARSSASCTFFKKTAFALC